MQFLENNLNCAGFCHPHPWKSFSRIERQFNKPYEACGPALYTFLSEKGRMIGVFSSMIAVLLVLTSMFAFCLCCHPEHKKQRNRTYYNRID